MGNDKSSEEAPNSAYPHQQHEYYQQQEAMANQQQQTVKQQPQDIPQPKPMPPPVAQPQYVAVAAQPSAPPDPNTASAATQQSSVYPNLAQNPINNRPAATTAATVAATGAVIASQQQQPNAQYINPQQAASVPQGYVQITGADGKQYLVLQGPPGTVPMIVPPKPVQSKPVVKRKKYKTWGVKIIATSDQAKQKVARHQYESTMIVIGIVCEGDKYDGFNHRGAYGGYGYSVYGDLDRKKFITMKVKVTDQIAIQQNRDKHYLEFWINGKMFNKVIALDPGKKFQIRVGSTNHDYDVQLY